MKEIPPNQLEDIYLTEYKNLNDVLYKDNKVKFQPQSNSVNLDFSFICHTLKDQVLSGFVSVYKKNKFIGEISQMDPIWFSRIDEL